MSREYKSLTKVRRELRESGITNPQEVINAIRTDIPNVRMPLTKNGKPTYRFMLGVSRMYRNHELTNGETISGINSALHYITSDAHMDEYDSNLNGMTSKEIIERFKAVEDVDVEKDRERSLNAKHKRNELYSIERIDTYEKATKYSPYTSWCITTSENMYKSYTSDGLGLFYVVSKKGFETMKRPNAGNNPKDEYGTSLIAISVKLNGNVNTVTSRYNHDCGGNDSCMTIEEVEQLIGMSFYEAFPPKSKEELRALGFSDKLGTLYQGPAKDGTYVEGIVVGVDENDRPNAIMGLKWVKNKETGSYNMTWDEANKYANQGPWHLPSSDELDRILKFRAIINDRIDELNKKIEAGEIKLLTEDDD